MDDRVDLGGLPDIGQVDDGLIRRGLGFPNGLLQRVPVGSGEQDLRAGANARDGHVFPKSARGAGDDDALPGQFHT